MRLQQLWSAFVRKVAGAAGFQQQRAHHFYPAVLNHKSVVVDLGAHKGEFTRFISEKYGCSVFGLEANPHLFSALPQLPGVQFLNLAIHRENAPLVFHLSENPEASSVFAEVAQGAGTLTPVEVAGITLDSLFTTNTISSVELLKVDIESAEFEMLETVSEKTLHKITQITVEFHVTGNPKEYSAGRARKICKRMERFGFRTFVMDRDFTDVLFLRTSRIPWRLMERLAMLIHRFVVTPARGLTHKRGQPIACPTGSRSFIC